MTRRSLLEELANAGVKHQALNEAMEGVDSDYGDAPSLCRLMDDANDRLERALGDYIRTANELRRYAMKKKEPAS